jgi:hypothetical protein
VSNFDEKVPEWHFFHQPANGSQDDSRQKIPETKSKIARLQAVHKTTESVFKRDALKQASKRSAKHLSHQLLAQAAVGSAAIARCRSTLTGDQILASVQK